MKTAIDLFKKALKYPVIWVGVIYLFWFILIPIDESFIIGLKLLGVYLAVTALKEILSKNRTSSIILLVVLLPVSWVYIVLGLDLFFSTVGWLGRAFIYIPLILLFSGYAAYNLFQRPSTENRSLLFFQLVVIFPILATNMAYSVSCLPEIIDQKEFGNFKYYIVWGIDFDYRDHLSFYKCEKWNIKCDKPYRTYSQMYFEKIVVDKEKNEVSAVDGKYKFGLVFTYGEKSRRYGRNSVQLEEHAYQMAIDENDYKVCLTATCTYTLYECDLDYTSCNPLPIQYSTTYDGFIYLSINETANEINATDGDDNLIFTYGEHSVCHADGCVILGQ